MTEREFGGKHSEGRRNRRHDGVQLDVVPCSKWSGSVRGVFNHNFCDFVRIPSRSGDCGSGAGWGLSVHEYGDEGLVEGVNSGVLQVEGDAWRCSFGVNINHHWGAGKLQSKLTCEGDALLGFLRSPRQR